MQYSNNNNNNFNNNFLDKYLHVAEKPSVAKEVSRILSKNSLRNRQSLSNFNPNYDFEFTLQNGEKKQFTFTSVLGHLMEKNFEEKVSRWELITIPELFRAEILTNPKKDCIKVIQNIQKEIQNSSTLVIWTDCDREGENIGFEVIKICQEKKYRLNIFRANFSALTHTDIFGAIYNLGLPNKNLSDAVECRMKLDLLIGSVFTRFQTLLFKDIFYQRGTNEFKEAKSISYGPCLFPTLYFIVERHDQIRKHKSEDYFFIEMAIEFKNEVFFSKENNENFGNNNNNNNPLKNNANLCDKDYPCIIFNWNITEKIFDFKKVKEKFEKIQQEKFAYVKNCTKKHAKKYKPWPMNTIDFTRKATKILKIGGALAMEIAETLYQKGFISYPRTETQIYPEKLNFFELINEQKKSENWGNYAQKILEKNDFFPSKGKSDDKSHPPIYPLKILRDEDIEDILKNDRRKEFKFPLMKKVYELVSRHFIATFSEDAQGEETEIFVGIGTEMFHKKGLIVTNKGYLGVYPYEKWSENELPQFFEGQSFPLAVINDKEFLKEFEDEFHYAPNEKINRFHRYVNHCTTTAPEYLTESDLISLMDLNGIGTDATIAEHIKNVQEK